MSQGSRSPSRRCPGQHYDDEKVIRPRYLLAKETVSRSDSTASRLLQPPRQNREQNLRSTWRTRPQCRTTSFRNPLVRPDQDADLHPDGDSDRASCKGSAASWSRSCAGKTRCASCVGPGTLLARSRCRIPLKTVSGECGCVAATVWYCDFGSPCIFMRVANGEMSRCQIGVHNSGSSPNGFGSIKVGPVGYACKSYREV